MRKGYRSALKRFKLTENPDFLGRDELSERGGHRELTRLLALEHPPTAVILQSDCMAIGAYRCLHENGLQPGRDLALFGGVLTGELAQYLSPRLSGFSVDLQPLGVRLAEALLARMAAQGQAATGDVVQQLWSLDILQGESDRITGG